MAITLSLLSAFPFLGGDGIAFDATSGGLFAVGSRQVENLPGDAENLIRAEAVLARFALDDAQNGTLLFEKKGNSSTTVRRSKSHERFIEDFSIY